MPHHNSHTYEFGPYRLDVCQRVLTRTGEAVSLTPKATDILTLLVANALAVGPGRRAARLRPAEVLRSE